MPIFSSRAQCGCATSGHKSFLQYGWLIYSGYYIMIMGRGEVYGHLILWHCLGGGVWKSRLKIYRLYVKGTFDLIMWRRIKWIKINFKHVRAIKLKTDISK